MGGSIGDLPRRFIYRLRKPLVENMVEAAWGKKRTPWREALLAGNHQLRQI